MDARAEALAARFEQVNNAAIATIERCSVVRKSSGAHAVLTKSGRWRWRHTMLRRVTPDLPGSMGPSPRARRCHQCRWN